MGSREGPEKQQEDCGVEPDGEGIALEAGAKMEASVVQWQKKIKNKINSETDTHSNSKDGKNTSKLVNLAKEIPGRNVEV